jgi:hypothetical protein
VSVAAAVFWQETGLETGQLELIPLKREDGSTVLVVNVGGPNI